MIRSLGSVGIWLLLWSGWLLGGSLHVSVDKREVLAGESVLLTITIVGEEYERMPDIPSIGGVQVRSSRRSHSSNFLYRDGKSIMELTESLMLELKPTKDMQVPPFQMEVDGKMLSSDPIDIKIVSSKAQQPAPFRVDLQLDKEKIVEGEPLIAKLYYREEQGVDVIRVAYQAPAFPDFFVQQIGKEKRYRAKGYRVHELTYLLLAKRSGTLKLPAVEVKVAQRATQEAFGGAISGVPQWHSIHSQAKSITVKPLTDHYDLVGHYALEVTLDRVESQPNTPVNLTLSLEGEGSLEDFEGVTFEIEGVSVYGDEANITTEIKGGKLHSHYTQHYALVGDHDFEIPAVELRAFDYTTGKAERLSSPAYKINVANSHPVEEPKVITLSSNATVMPKKVQPTHTSPPHSSSRNLYWWLALLGAFCLGVVVTLLGRYYGGWLMALPLRLREKISDEALFEEGLRVLYPHMGAHPEIEAMVRDLYAHREHKVITIDKARLKRMVEYFKNKEETQV